MQAISEKNIISNCYYIDSKGYNFRVEDEYLEEDNNLWKEIYSKTCKVKLLSKEDYKNNFLSSFKFKFLETLLSIFAGISTTLILVLIIILFSTSQAHASNARLKDIINFEGVRENMLVGYGLVVGLNGTGDKLNNSVFTEKSLQAFLSRLGVGTMNEKLQVKNVAAVTVTAKLPPFARAGSKIDVTVSTLGDSKSLEGGTLVATPLMGADGEMYAVAQGPVSIGGFSAGTESANVTKNIPTTGVISNGAIVEREVSFVLNNMSKINLALKNPDLTTAKEIEAEINKKLGDNYAIATDPGTVSLMIPLEYTTSVASLLAQIEQLSVTTDNIAKIIIDEKTGTVVMNNNVKIDPVAVAQGSLVVTILKTPLISQPGTLAPASAQTIATQGESINVEEIKGNIAKINANANLDDLVTALNTLGVGTRDLITILQTIKQSGALQAEIETR
ncbi:MAG: flagellar basal body P-ring protein FlgI [Rickettsiales bacterium]|nr:flagellar basal body P-ring protein FlgI [Rickettsiales bacterium]